MAGGITVLKCAHYGVENLLPKSMDAEERRSHALRFNVSLGICFSKFRVFFSSVSLPVKGTLIRIWKSTKSSQYIEDFTLRYLLLSEIWDMWKVCLRIFRKIGYVKN